MSSGTPQDEYGHVTEHILHYANARFKQLTLFIALSAGLVGILYSKSGVTDDTIRVALKLLGIATVIVFWVLEQSSNRWWLRFVLRAAELEKELGYDCFKEKPVPTPLWANATRAVCFFYTLIVVCWVSSLYFKL